MRLSDLCSLPLAALWQQKTRTILTTLGVVFGTFVLTASLSVGQGVQDQIERESHREDFLRRINVSSGNPPGESEKSAGKSPVEGDMSEAKRERIRRAMEKHKARWGVGAKLKLRLTRDKIRDLAALPHVQEVTPGYFWLSGRAFLNQREQIAEIQMARVDDPFFRQCLVAGRCFESSHERSILVSEFLLYGLGITDDVAVKNVLGKKLRLEFEADRRRTGFALYFIKPDGSVDTTREEAAAIDTIRQRLPTSLDKLGLTPAQVQLLQKSFGGKERPRETVVEEFEIVGVLRAPTDEEQQQPWEFREARDVVLPVETATDLLFRIPADTERALDNAVVRVDDEQNTKAVYQRIKELGWTAHAPLDFVDQQRMQYLLIFAGMSCVAVVALLVAALGIANTMLMSVLERTREIGVMKAVGAGNGDLQLIFVIEGALIGLVGGGLGLLLAWGASIPGDIWVRSMVSRDMKIELKQAIFVFPPWLTLSVMAFAVLMTTLAAVYPARRAAKIDPVAALRHE